MRMILACVCAAACVSRGSRGLHEALRGHGAESPALHGTASNTAPPGRPRPAQARHVRPGLAVRSPSVTCAAPLLLTLRPWDVPGSAWEKLGRPPLARRMLRSVPETADDAATASRAARDPRDTRKELDPELQKRRAESDAADHVLVDRAQGGDRVALGELLHKYGPGLYRSVLLPRLGTETAAKEALAETYAKVVANISKFTWQNVGFYPWLRTVALRIALDQLRARKRLVLFDIER